MPLSREKILKHAGMFPTQEVHVPAWADETGDDVVLVRGMTVREFEINQAALGKEDGEATAALVARCVVDESGGRVFEDKDVRQIAELGFKQINEIGRAISDLSGLSAADDDDTAEDESDVESGKSSSAPSADADSGSPAMSSAGSSSDSPAT